MAYFYRLITCFLLCASVPAFAVIQWLPQANPSVSYATPLAACKAVYSSSVEVTMAQTDLAYCVVYEPNRQHAGYVYSIDAPCPAGTSNIDGVCKAPPPTVCVAPQVVGPGGVGCVAPVICTAPQVLNASGTACTTPLVCTGHTHKNAAGTACEPDTPQQICWSNAVLASQYNTDREVILKGNLDTDHLCVTTDGLGPGTGCTAKMDSAIKYALPDGTYVTNGNISFDVGEPVGPGGTTCALTSSEKPVSNKCVNGQPGKVNGVDVCIPFPPGTTATTKTSGSTTGNSPSGNPVDIKTDTVNTCTGASCNSVTTTTVTTNINGTVTTNSSSVTTTGPKSEFCTVHPRDNQCGQIGEGNSSFTGSCLAGFSCDGDALLCAIAKEEYRINCKLYEPDSNAQNPFANAMAGNDPGDIDKLKNSAASVTISQLDTNGFGWSRACPADPVIPLGFVNASFSIPFSRICDPLSVLSIAGVGITLLGAMLWVLGSKKS